MDCRRANGEKARGQVRIFVKRGALRRFHRLKRDTAELPVSVEWDRRTGGERPEGEATAQSERRKDPPYTWEAAEFVLTDAPEDQE